MNADEKLIMSTVVLKRSAPKEWAEFVGEFRSFVERTRDRCVMCSLEDLQRTQGRAQGAKALLELFDNAENTAASIEKRRSAQKQ